MQKIAFKKFIPGIAWFFVVLILICLPGEDIPKPRGWFEWMRLANFDKLVHSGLFAVLNFLFILPFAKSGFTQEKKWYWFKVITAISCAWGLGTELIQLFFIPTRQFDLVDWAADSIGVFLSFIFCKLVFLNKKARLQ